MKNSMKKRLHHLVLTILTLTVLLTGVSLKNSENVQAATSYPYLIKVNRKMCTVTVYEKDSNGKYTVPVKAMLCSPGYDTPLGTFKTPEKYRWRLLMDDVWGQYSTRITGGILFHSVWYYEKDPSTLSNEQFNKLGTMCSHGCVRLNVADAKWIYDNCPIGTTVTIYDSSNPGPLGKPEGIKVSEKSLMGYDPTDIWSKGNPYTTAKPVISGVKNKTIDYGKKVNLTKGVTAVSSTGEDITDEITITIKYKNKTVKKVNSKKTGKYYITYSVKDRLNKTIQEEVIYTVVDNEVPEISGVENIYLNTEPDEHDALENVTVTWHDKEIDKDDIVLKWKTISEAETLKKYKVTYSYEASNGKSVKASAKIYYDTEAPVITGVEDGMLQSKEQLTRENLLANVSVSDNLNSLTVSDIEVTTESQGTDIYKVQYKISDYAGNVTEVEAIYTIATGFGIIGVKDRVILADQIVDQNFAREGVKAYEDGADVSGKMVVVITPYENGYQITYIITSVDGAYKMETALFIIAEENTETE